MYTFVFRIEFFPFMNVLTAVIAVGVGADDTFILYKAWQEAAAEAEAAAASTVLPLSKVVRCALKHSAHTMLVTSVTTAAAFFASLVSNITAIKCFR